MRLYPRRRQMRHKRFAPIITSPLCLLRTMNLLITPARVLKHHESLQNSPLRVSAPKRNNPRSTPTAVDSPAVDPLAIRSPFCYSLNFLLQPFNLQLPKKLLQPSHAITSHRWPISSSSNTHIHCHRITPTPSTPSQIQTNTPKTKHTSPA